MSKQKEYGLYNTEPVIRTFTGKYFNVFEPNIDDICIEDIAHSLSHQCRFGGHLPVFYSVAQHSYLCTQLVDKEHELAALLHDASEAYLLDIPRPIKKRLTEYHAIEDNLMKLIAEKFGFEYPLHKSVKKADEIMLQIEWDDLMLQGKTPRIQPLGYLVSERVFLGEFERLTT